MDVREHNIRGSTELRESYMDLNDLFSFSWLGGRKRLCLNVSSSGFIRISDPVPEGGGGGGVPGAEEKPPPIRTWLRR